MRPASLLSGPPRSHYGDLTVVVPTCNEVATVSLRLRELATQIPGATVLVADDSSSDFTQNVAAHFQGPLQVRVLRRDAVPVGGPTPMVIAALREVSTPYFIVLDAELRPPPGALWQLYKHASNGADLVIARRPASNAPRPSARVTPSLARALTNGYLRAQGRSAVSDPISGFFGGKTRVARAVLETREEQPGTPDPRVLVEILKFTPRGTRIAEVTYAPPSDRASTSDLTRLQMLSLLRQLGPAGKATAFTFESILSRSFWKFIGVGLSGVLINQALLAMTFGGLGLPLLLASLLSIEGAILWNFAWNDRWSFAGRGRACSWRKRLGRFNTHCAAGAGVNAALLHLLVSSGTMHYLTANLVGIALATTLNWTFAHHWTWLDDMPGSNMLTESPPADRRELPD